MKDIVVSVFPSSSQTADRELSFSVHPSTAAIAPELWNRLATPPEGGPANPFLDHAFFLALEQSGCATPETGWQPQHILALRGDTPVGLMPLFLKSHSMGEYVFDHGWANAFERAGGQYYPKLQCSVPFTPATTPKLLVPSGDIAVAAGLLDAARTLAERRNASSVHITFTIEDEERLAEAAGWLVRYDTQYHWHNQGFATFEDFLDTLQSRKRKAIRRERRAALIDGLDIVWLTGAEITEAHWDAFHAFYMDTGSRKWGRPYLNRDFFSRIGQSMSDRIVLMFAYDGAEPIAGALNFRGDNTLFGRNWGCTRDVPFLHFELCYYQAIDYAIAHGLKTVEAGAQGEHKLARGYGPSITRSLHHLVHPGLREAVAAFLSQERDAVLHDAESLMDYTPFRKG